MRITKGQRFLHARREKNSICYEWTPSLPSATELYVLCLENLERSLRLRGTCIYIERGSCVSKDKSSVGGRHHGYLSLDFGLRVSGLKTASYVLD